MVLSRKSVKLFIEYPPSAKYSLTTFITGFTWDFNNSLTSLMDIFLLKFDLIFISPLLLNSHIIGVVEFCSLSKYSM